jgi:hypothetical protein
MKNLIPEEKYRLAGIYIIRNLVNDKIYLGSVL